MSELLVREATAADMPAVAAIYAPYVTDGLATFEEVPPDASELESRRLAIRQVGLPYLVAQVDGAIVGYSYASTYRARPAYRHTLEDSIYVAAGRTGRGIGRALLTELLARCDAGGWRQMIGIIGDSGNHASIALHERLGFRHIGTLQSVGFKLGRWVDTVFMQRELGEGSRIPPGRR